MRKHVKVVKKLEGIVSLQALYNNNCSQEFLSEIRLANEVMGNQSCIYLNSRKIERKLFTTTLVNSKGEMANYVIARYWKKLDGGE